MNLVAPTLDQRIYKVRESERMTEAASLVLATIADCRTPEQAITGPTIQAKTGINERVVKAAVKELIEVHGLPVVGTRRHPYPGYFLTDNPEHIETAVAVLRSEVGSIVRRIAALKGMAVKQAERQLALELAR